MLNTFPVVTAMRGGVMKRVAVVEHVAADNAADALAVMLADVLGAEWSVAKPHVESSLVSRDVTVVSREITAGGVNVGGVNV